MLAAAWRLDGKWLDVLRTNLKLAGWTGLSQDMGESLLLHQLFFPEAAVGNTGEVDSDEDDDLAEFLPRKKSTWSG